MNDDMRLFMARTNPKSLKTVIDKARYGSLDECLSIGEIAELWGKDGLLKGSDEWKDTVDFLVGLVKSDSLDCENKNIALGEIDRSQEDYNRILSAFSHGATRGKTVFLDPTKAPIKRDSLKKFLDKHDGWDLVNDFLIRKWWPAEINGKKEIEINPAHLSSPTNLERDRLALELVKQNPELKEKIKSEVKTKLENHNRIFKQGFKDWWDTQIIFDKISKGGRPRKQQPKK